MNELRMGHAATNVSEKLVASFTTYTTSTSEGSDLSQHQRKSSTTVSSKTFVAGLFGTNSFLANSRSTTSGCFSFC